MELAVWGNFYWSICGTSSNSAPKRPFCMMLVAIDPGTKCGYAFRKPSGIVDSGQLNLKPTDTARNSLQPALFIQDWLTGWNATHEVTKVGVEWCMPRHGPDVWMLMSITTAIALWCSDHAIPWERIPIGTWKKFGTGNGNIRADAYHHQARQRWPELDVQTADEAAALFMLNYLEKSTPAT